MEPKPTNILVVDDEPQLERLILQGFRKKIRKGEFEFSFALNGVEALTKLRQNPDIDIVLSDINMPEMDGITFISNLNEFSPMLKTIMVSAYGDMPNIRRAMNHGAYDFVTKPIDFADLEATIQKAIKETEVLKAATQENERLNRIQQQLESETLRLKELDAFKTKLYTNITHEFRTPLTVIMGMTAQLRENEEEKEIISRNCQRLLNLINQMLDLRKLESGNMHIQWVRGDVIQYVRYIQESFHSFAKMNNVRIHFLADPEDLLMDYDEKKLLNITSNLISNAIKYTTEGGDIYVQMTKTAHDGQPVLKISVKDTGIGIAQDKLPFIFDRFYQVDDSQTRKEEGTGIGLSLTRELVRLFEGEISVKSTLGKGTEFQVLLPIHQQAHTQIAPSFQNIQEETAAFLPAQPLDSPGEILKEATAEDQALILIIEDNPDVAHYIQSCLQSHYRLAIAANGQAGIDQAIALVPDLIISDVMMPEKDGFEVCDTLKNHPNTSHIPLILLTARADVASKLAGLRRGADAYLAKPFDEEELLVRLQNLLVSRQKLQQYYGSLATNQEISSGSEANPGEEMENVFLRQVKEKIEAHLTDPQFAVNDLCLEMGMSHSQIHRKLIALTGMSITKLVRFIRLNKAKELLKDRRISIAAVAYDSGFSDPNYFHRVFKKAFKLTPTEFRNVEG